MIAESWADTCWPPEALADALLAVARAANLDHQEVTLRSLPSSAKDDVSIGHWLTVAADRLGLEVEPVSAGYPEMNAVLAGAGPALLRIEVAGRIRWLAVVRGGSRYIQVIGPDLVTARLRIAIVAAALRGPMEAPHAADSDKLLEGANLSPCQQHRVRNALLSERLARESLECCWMVRTRAGQKNVRWVCGLAVLIAIHAMEQCCWLLSWIVLGWMTFTGHLESGWLAAWGLFLGCVVAFRLWSETVGGRLSLDFSAALRRRLLAGALRMDPDQVRTEGTGGLLGRALEIESLEQLALGGGLQGVLSLVELLAAIVLLGPVAGEWTLAGVLTSAIGLAAGLASRHLRHCEEWTSARLKLTSDLVERMIGHRTTLAQESGDQETAAVDQLFDRYLIASQSLDQSARRLQTALPRLWLLCGLFALAPAFVKGSESVTSLAIALGGILFARQALQKFMESLDRVISARVSWGRLSRFLDSSRQFASAGDPDFAGIPADRGSKNEAAMHRAPTVLEGRDLVFRHARRSEPVLNGIGLTIHEHDHILLEGPSGGGKSTLGMVLAGSRTHQSGVLLLRGLDPPTLGSTWKRRVVLSPQFHHNHVFLGTFLYNLMLGSTWPPNDREVARAERVCRDLELGPLLDRMPGGLQQMVGETGWQLSHGECSRLFMARAILQGADVVLLDESFAALDPETLSRTLPHVVDQTPTLVVIAHP